MNKVIYKLMLLVGLLVCAVYGVTFAQTAAEDIPYAFTTDTITAQFIAQGITAGPDTTFVAKWYVDDTVVKIENNASPGTDYSYQLDASHNGKSIKFEVQAVGTGGGAAGAAASSQKIVTLPVLKKVISSYNIVITTTGELTPGDKNKYTDTVGGLSPRTYTVRIMNGTNEISDYSGVKFLFTGTNKDSFVWNAAQRTLTFSEPYKNGPNNTYKITLLAYGADNIGSEAELEVTRKNFTLAFAQQTMTKSVGSPAFTNSVSGTNGGTVTYQSSATNVATVDASSGQVTIVGAGTATITATESPTPVYADGQTATFVLTVNGAITATANTAPQVLTQGAAMTAFSPLTSVSGGTTPYTYEVKTGTLPTGVTLNASTGVVSGTPTAAYTAQDVVFQVKDASDTVCATTSTVNIAVKEAMTAIGAITGTAAVGETLTAGALTPSGATVTYQWQSSSDNVTYSDISSATSATYVLTSSELGKYIKVKATGTGSYTGSKTSTPTAQVTQAVTAVAITGTAAVGSQLTAGVTPGTATVTYQWQSSSDNVTYSDISSATSATYVLTASELGKYIKVKATGTGSYTGSATSTATGVVGGQPVTAIGAITGTTVVGATLTAGALTPSGATVTYQWLSSSNVDGPYSDISGATSASYNLFAFELGKYIKVRVTGTGSYTGSQTSTPTAKVTTPVSNIQPIEGTAAVGETLTVGPITPFGATVTYQWQSSSDNVTYSDISGATGNTYVIADTQVGKYIKVEVTGTGPYTGSKTSTATAQVTQAVTAIGTITGTAAVGETLTAGPITPTGATVTYQWQSSSDNLTYSDISSATSATYVLTASEVGKYIKVKATGTGSYTGSKTSDATAKVTQAVTAIGAITGTAAVGETLTAGALTPSGATVTYQWQSSDTVGGTYSNISGATSATYVLTASELNKYIKVQVTGTGSYTGTILSAATGLVGGQPVTAIGAITGTAAVGETLTAGALTPSGATVTYQWQSCATVGGTYSNISGATSATYTLAEAERGKFIKVQATGTGSYTGTVLSAATAQVTQAVTAVAITGTAAVGSTLSAGVTPGTATVTYQWQSCATVGGTYDNISGATSATYVLTASELNKYIKVQVTGTGSYTGTILSAATGLVGGQPVTAIGAITGTAAVGETLTAGALTPSGATVTYQWQSSDTVGGTYSNISGATSATYTLAEAERGKFIKVQATGTGSYTGTVLSAATAQVTQAVTAVAITGTAAVGSTLSAGVTPGTATVTYQWQSSDTVGGTYSNISGATSATYVLTASELNKYIKVQVTGTGSYTGTILSAATGLVGGQPVTAIGAITGTAAVGETLTAGALTPSGATVTYQWQSSDTVGGTYSNISGATSATYTLAEAERGKFIKVQATGTGSYTGTVLSAATAQVTQAVTAVAITGTAAVGSTLSAGVTPGTATVTYQWQSCATVGGTYDNISGATSATYVLTASELNKYIKVQVTGTGSYTGTILSAATGLVGGQPVTAIGAITGTAAVGETLTAGALTPSGATVTYQWQSSDTVGRHIQQHHAARPLRPIRWPRPSVASSSRFRHDGYGFVHGHGPERGHGAGDAGCDGRRDHRHCGGGQHAVRRGNPGHGDCDLPVAVERHGRRHIQQHQRRDLCDLYAGRGRAWQVHQGSGNGYGFVHGHGPERGHGAGDAGCDGRRDHRHCGGGQHAVRRGNPGHGDCDLPVAVVRHGRRHVRQHQRRDLCDLYAGRGRAWQVHQGSGNGYGFVHGHDSERGHRFGGWPAGDGHWGDHRHCGGGRDADRRGTHA